MSRHPLDRLASSLIIATACLAGIAGIVVCVGVM